MRQRQVKLGRCGGRVVLVILGFEPNGLKYLGRSCWKLLGAPNFDREPILNYCLKCMAEETLSNRRSALRR